MKRYIYIAMLALVVVSCEKSTGETAPLPPQYVFCNLEDEPEDLPHVVHVGRDGGEFVIQVAYLDDKEMSYFGCYVLRAGEYYEHSDGYGYLNLDNYNCQWFEFNRIGNHRFKLKFYPVDDTYDKIKIGLVLTANIGVNGNCIPVGYHDFEIY